MAGVLISIISLFGSAAVGGAVGLFAGFPAGTAVFAILLLFALQLRLAANQRRERRLAGREIAGLKRAHAAIEQALGEAQAKMEVIREAAEARSSAQGRKIVAELQVLESLMREFAGRISEKAAPDAAPVASGQAPGARAYLESMGESDLLETIRASLEENRVDLYLQPIVSLPQRKLRYYEALSRLRAENGSVIMPAQYMKVAAPAGLMSVVDNLLLFRCVQIVRRLTHKNRDVAVFCNISGDTLTDAEFFPQFLEYMRQNKDLAGQIVFEFGQEAVAKAGAKGEENLIVLAGLGFALSMDHVDALALDFGRLKRIGFRHLKLRADVLLGGMSHARAAVGPEDFKTLLARHGLNLIVERVEDEKTVVQLLEYGVDFAQGYLFGEPRAVRDDKPEKTEPAAPVIPFRKSA
ncbi:MAG: EAL domain-containing protein [Alphaproteobacteria bacterium]|nr:EAL domain-containing protein [Alphaproteobacteria bacterium]MBV9694934.1 EAL domain-containing protein [Alphaproteobacteria bacterium]